MIWLLPAAGCSISIALILKLNEQWGGDRRLIAAANYIAASLLSLAFLIGEYKTPSTATLVIGGLAGIDFVLGFLLLMAGIARGPLAVPVTVMRLSVALPIVVSVFIWAEEPSGLQWIGICMGIAAIILFGFSLQDGGGRRRTNGYWFFMISLFLVMGVGDLLIKAFREMSSADGRFLFTWVLFSTAALFSSILVLVNRIPFNRRTFLLGLLLGVPNLFSTVFILMALRSTPASIAFPFVNIAVIMGSAFFGFVIWRERLGRVRAAGLALAALALILLPLG